MTIEIVVFDIDDTLYLERDYVRSGFEACGRLLEAEYGLDRFGDTAWHLFESGVRGDTFDRALVDIGGEPDRPLVERLVATYRAHDPDIALLPDARRAIDQLGAHHRLAVVTDGPEPSQAAKARRLGTDTWADPTVLTSTLPPGSGKPSPAAFELIEQRLGASGDRCVYVADNPAKDFAGPASLGWRTVRIRRPGQLHEAVPSGADVGEEIGDLDAIAVVLGAPAGR